MNRVLTSLVLGTVTVASSLLAGAVHAQMSTPIALSDSLGPTIDAKEQIAYHLFPEVKDFISGQIVLLPSGQYRLEYSTGEMGAEVILTQDMSSKTFEQLKTHVMFVEKHFAVRDAEFSGKGAEAHGLYALALRYAAEGSYDRTVEYLSELIKGFPDSPEAGEARDLYPKAEALQKAKRTSFKIEPVDQSGRTDLLVFSGYYGLWLGIATPIALEADEPTAYGIGMLVAGPTAVLATHYLTRNRGISDGSATMIALGGNWGIWQGIGWYYALEESDEDANAAIAAGELAGLGGLALGAILASQLDFTPGGAELISAGAGWGGWFGVIVGDYMDSALTGALVGSDALAIGAGIVAWDSEWSRKRIRYTNLAGVLGTIAGFGIDIIVHPDDDEAILAIAGAGSIAGLVTGAWMTRNTDSAADVSLSGDDAHDPSRRVSVGNCRDRWSINPLVELQRDGGKKPLPCVGFQVSF